MTQEQIERFGRLHNNEQLVGFLREYDSADIFPNERLDAPVNHTDQGFFQIGCSLEGESVSARRDIFARGPCVATQCLSNEPNGLAAAALS